MTPQTIESGSGWWCPKKTDFSTAHDALKNAISQLNHPVYLIEKNRHYAVGSEGYALLGDAQPPSDAWPLAGYAPACRFHNLGDPSFCTDYQLHYPYIAGAMAHGIGSADIVEEMGRNGMLGFFGTGGLPLPAIEATIDRISAALGKRPYGFNLIYSPYDPHWETAVTELYLKRGIRLVSAAAYLHLTLPIVRYRVHGIHRNASGHIITPNRIIAKVSRIEVATHFLSPPPEHFLRQLVADGDITEEQAGLAAQIPMAQDLTAEADSGGHTDNRPAITLIPMMLALRDQMQAQYNYKQSLRIGAAGGIATPVSAAAAFAMGAAFVLTGSINQACVESGSSDLVRRMLAATQQADVTMAPAADMFEMGVKVQVLKRGTMFAMRAAKLYELYRKYKSIEDIRSDEREMLERKIFRDSLANVWQQTQQFFLQRDARQIERANREPKHKMALIFRSYLGRAVHWANSGDPDRKVDYQIWCGPAMGTFNEWVKGSFLEQPENRRVVTIALNILYGAGIIQRLNILRIQGVQLPADFWKYSPLTQEALQEKMNLPLDTL